MSTCKATIPEIENEIAEALSSHGTSFTGFTQVDSGAEISGRIDETEIAEYGTMSLIVLSVFSTLENTVELFHEGKVCAPRRHSKPPEKPTILTEVVRRDDRKDGTKDDNGAYRQGGTSQSEVNLANKGTSVLLTAECIQNWLETFVVYDCRQHFRLEILLVNVKKFWKRIPRS